MNVHKGSTLLEQTHRETNNLCMKLTKNNLQAMLIVKLDQDPPTLSNKPPQLRRIDSPEWSIGDQKVMSCKLYE